MSAPGVTRRGFLVTAAAAAVLAPARRERFVWRGSALGGEARIVLEGPRDAAEDAARAAAAEISRLERLFSLHRPESQLVALNRDGRLDHPARDFRRALLDALDWTRRTEGAFDAAVQPLFAHHAAGATSAPPLARVADARVRVQGDRVALSPGAALTLNGFAQGLVADAVTDLLLRRGFTPTLIDAGELRLPGAARQDVALADARVTLRLARTAVAVSRPGALTFPGGGGHIFDPREGVPTACWRSVAVIAPSAAAADALSTAFAASSPERIGDLRPVDAAVLAVTPQGELRRFGRLPNGAIA